MKTFLTHLERILTDEGKEKSLYIPYFRTIEETGYGRSIQGKPISIKHIVPTSYIHFDNLPKFQQRMHELNRTEFAEHNIVTYFGDNDGRYFIWHAEMPHLPEKDRRTILPKKFLTGHEDRITRMGWWRAKAPYCIYDYDEITGAMSRTGEPCEQYVSLEHLLAEKKCAIDIETEDWRKEELTERILNMNDSELAEFYQNLAKETEAHDHPERVKHWQRKDYLTKIEMLIDSLRQEKISAASYITFRDNDTLVHTFECLKDAAEIEVAIPGNENEKRKVKLAYAKDTEALGESLTEIIQKDDPLIVFGTNHLNFDYKKLDQLTRGKFMPGVGREAPKYNANIVKDFQQRRIIQGRLDIDTFAYSLQSSWTYRNNLDTTFNYMLNKNEKKTLNYDELIIKTQQAKKGNKDAATEILYYAAQDAMKSYLIGDYILPEVLSHSKQFSAQTSKICTASKKTLATDKLQKESWERKKTYRKFDEQEAKAWDDFSIYDNFWQKLNEKRELANFRAKQGMFQSQIIFPTIYYETLLPAIAESVKEGTQLLRSTADAKQKIRLMEYINADLEWVLYTLRKEYAHSLKKVPEKEKERHKELCDIIFRKTFGIKGKHGGLAVDMYANSLIEKMNRFYDTVKNVDLINHSERFLVLEQNLITESIVHELEEKNLAILLGKGRTLSGTRGRFVSLIDGHLLSQGLDPEGKRFRCEYETEIIQGFFNRVIELNDPAGALHFADEKIKQFYNNGLPSGALTITAIAKRKWHEYSDKATTRRTREAVAQEADKGQKYKYDRTETEMFGANGSIRRTIQMRFPSASRKEAFAKLLNGEADEADLNEIIRTEASRKL